MITWIRRRCEIAQVMVNRQITSRWGPHWRSCQWVTSSEDVLHVGMDHGGGCAFDGRKGARPVEHVGPLRHGRQTHLSSR